MLNQNKNHLNNYFMGLALEQAKKTIGNTKENPAVGCVITKNNQIIGAGHTSINGRPHAEKNAITFSNQKIENSYLYVTIEPCSHFGKTPPCVNLIIKKKVKKVFFSINDPDFRSYDKSSKILRKKGINVNKGLLSKKIKKFYRSYLLYKNKKFPFVTSKLAVSKDYFTINKSKSKWITNKFSRGRVHLMRSFHDCILTSSNTIVSDNPKMTCRISGLNSNSPSRIILDRNLKIPVKSKILNDAYKFKTIIFFNKYNKKKIKLLNKLKIKTYKLPLDEENFLDLKKCLIKAKELGFSRIFLESGIKLNQSFLNKNLVDEFKLFISNKKLKKNGSYNAKKCLRRILLNKSKIEEKVNLFNDKLLSYKLK